MIDPLGPSFRARPVVGHQQDERVVDVPGLREKGEEPGQLGIGVGEKAGEALHESGRHPLFPGRQLVPGRDPVGTRRHLGARWEEPGGLLASEGRLPPPVPTSVEVTAIALDPLPRGMVRRVARPRAEVEKKRPIDVNGAQITEIGDSSVGQVGAQVVALLDRAGRQDRMVVVVEGGDELVGLAAMEPIPAVEAAGEGPRMARGGHVRLVVGCEMPFADRVGGVALSPQDLREEAVLTGDLTVVAGIAHGQIGHSAEAVAVVVASREQAGPRGRAQRGGVEVGEPEATLGQAVDRRSGDVGAVAAQLGEAHVVEHDEQDIGGALGRAGHFRPPRCRLPPVVADHALERLCLHSPSRFPRTSGEVIAPPRRLRDRAAVHWAGARLRTVGPVFGLRSPGVPEAWFRRAVGSRGGSRPGGSRTPAHRHRSRP